MNKVYILRVLKEERFRLVREQIKLEKLAFSPHIAHPEVYAEPLHNVNLDIKLCEEAIKELEVKFDEV